MDVADYGHSFLTGRGQRTKIDFQPLLSECDYKPVGMSLGPELVKCKQSSEQLLLIVHL